MIHEFMNIVVPPIASFLELIGVAIILIGAFKSLRYFIFHNFNFYEREPKLELATALAYSLEFKLAGEILKTIVVRTLDEFTVLAAIVILRVILTFVIHWEIKSSETENIAPSGLVRAKSTRKAAEK